MFKIGFIRHKERSLERLVLGVTEAFGGLLSVGGAMIRRGGFWMFLGGFSVVGHRRAWALATLGDS